MYRFNGFTQKANHAMNLAIQCAEEMGHTYVGSEHILLGLLRESTGVAAGVLQQRNITADVIEQKLVETVGRGVPTRLTPNDFTPRSKRILELAIDLDTQVSPPISAPCRRIPPAKHIVSCRTPAGSSPRRPTGWGLISR